VLDSGGFSSIWLKNASYRFVIYSKGLGGVQGSDCFSGVLQRTVDLVSAYASINQAQALFLLGQSSDPAGSAGELIYRTDIPCFRGFSTLWDCFVTLAGVQTLTNKTYNNAAFTGAATGLIATSPTLNNPNINGTVVTGPPATYLVMANDIVTGTVLNRLAKINPAGLAGFAILPLITDTGGVVGVVVAGAGASLNATIQQSGSASCVFDNAVTAGDYVQISSSVAGDCHDAGVTFPITGQVVGRLLATNGAAGTYLIDLFGPEIRNSSVTLVGKADATAQSANIGPTLIYAVPSTGQGMYRVSCYVVLTQVATTSSTLPSCQMQWTDADSSVAESNIFTITNTGNVLGGVGGTSGVGGNVTPPFGIFVKASTNINYSTTGYASVGATPMQYAIHVRVEGTY